MPGAQDPFGRLLGRPGALLGHQRSPPARAQHHVALFLAHASGRGCHAAAVAGAGAATAGLACAGLLGRGHPAGDAALRRRGSRSLRPGRGPEPRQPPRIGQVVTAAPCGGSGKARSPAAIAAARACRSSAGSWSPQQGLRTPGQAPQGRRPGAAGEHDEEQLTHPARPQRLRPLHAVRPSGRPKPVAAQGTYPPLQRAPRRPGRP